MSMYLHSAVHETLGLKTHKLQLAFLYVNLGDAGFTSNTELNVGYLKDIHKGSLKTALFRTEVPCTTLSIHICSSLRHTGDKRLRTKSQTYFRCLELNKGLRRSTSCFYKRANAILKNKHTHF